MKFSELKQTAKQAMRKAKPSPVWVCLAVMVLLLVLQGLSFYIDGSYETLLSMMDVIETGDMSLYSETGTTSILGQVLTLALEVMTFVLSVGFTLYCMRICQEEQASVGDVFDAFGVFFRALWVSLLPAFMVSVWAMPYSLAVSCAMYFGQIWILYAALPLLFLPIRAWYSYRLTVYLMLDNPHLNCVQCMAMSRAILKGHLWELFRLDLSFIGWALLCVVPFVALWVIPYVNITGVAYYRAVMKMFQEKNPNLFPNAPEPPEDGEA